MEVYFNECYLSQNDALMTEITIAALRECNWGSKLLLSGDYVADLSQSEGLEQDEKIAAAPVVAGLEDTSSQFLLR